MFGSQILEVGIGLVFIYFIFSLVTSALTEAIANLISLRAKTLEEGLLKLLSPASTGESRSSVTSSPFAEKVLDHGLISNLGRTSRRNRRGLPSYLSANRFAHALLDSIVNLEPGGARQTTEEAVEAIADSVQLIDNTELQEALLTLINEVDDEIEAGVLQAAEKLIAVRKKVENWYDEMMARVSGWYKRSAQKIIFGVAVVIAASMNVDTLMIANTLWNAPAVQASTLR